MKQKIEFINILIILTILNANDVYCQIDSDKSLALNISRLLDKLLTNYSKSLRPTHELGTPTIVDTNIRINSLGPISNFEMSYTMDCYFRQEWKDSRLAFDAPFSQIILSMRMLELIWKPDTYFLNGKESYLHKIPTSNRLVRLSKDGSVLYSSRLTIKASCPMNLQDFPLDKQICPLWIGSFSYSVNEINYRWKIQPKRLEWKPIQIDDGVKLSQFDLISTDWNGSQYVKHGGLKFGFIGMNIVLKRHMGYYVLQVYIPCIMLVILSWVSFFINREATSDRSCIGIMCVLSLATLSFDVRNDIPSVPYVTALDWFLIMCYLFLFASLMEFTAVHYFTKVGFGDFQATLLDSFDHGNESDVTLEASVSKSSHLNNNFNQNYHKPKTFKHYLNNFWRCIISDPHFKKEMTKRAHHKGINSVSKCDRVSRILFPAFFLLLNILYWYNYYKNV